jgi:hypothetical protein
MVAFGAIEGPVGALRQPSTNPYREGGRSSVAGCFAAPYQGLSPVRGNLHAGFSGEGWTVKVRPLPDWRAALVIGLALPMLPLHNMGRIAHPSGYRNIRIDSSR